MNHKIAKEVKPVKEINNYLPSTLIIILRKMSIISEILRASHFYNKYNKNKVLPIVSILMMKGNNNYH